MSTDGATAGRDLLGRAMTDTEVRLLRLYREARALLDEDLAPAAAANVREAASALWMAANDLALIDERCEV